MNHHWVSHQICPHGIRVQPGLVSKLLLTCNHSSCVVNLFLDWGQECCMHHLVGDTAPGWKKCVTCHPCPLATSPLNLACIYLQSTGKSICIASINIFHLQKGWNYKTASYHSYSDYTIFNNDICRLLNQYPYHQKKDSNYRKTQQRNVDSSNW